MIRIECLEHNDQRYNTVGDWQWKHTTYDPIADELIIRVSRTGDWRSNFLVAIHELIEAFLCKVMGIPEHIVDAWDISHPDADDPGSLPGCPYCVPHMIGDIAERICCGIIGMRWADHERLVADVSETWIERPTT